MFARWSATLAALAAAFFLASHYGVESLTLNPVVYTGQQGRCCAYLYLRTCAKPNNQDCTLTWQMACNRPGVLSARDFPLDTNITTMFANDNYSICLGAFPVPSDPSWVLPVKFATLADTPIKGHTCVEPYTTYSQGILSNGAFFSRCDL